MWLFYGDDTSCPESLQNTQQCLDGKGMTRFKITSKKPSLITWVLAPSIKFPGVTPTLINDLILRKKCGETRIVDFTVAFADRHEYLVAVRNANVTKYQPIQESLRAAGQPVYLDAIVVDWLGT
ncbi:hypothetical protein TNCT_242281 [Trichonephila clavata]|uniref:Uncharacterized protein n=1 Tax=Trichonephila clavata TaxID=2740835 RepID=A0A8X6H2X7_TRICU|nr:hypothetical protein TNCT_242281 [Trichonephila clavata]